MRKEKFFYVSRLMVLFISLVLLIICNNDCSAEEVLRVARYGGSFGDLIDKHVCIPFEKKYGIKVVAEPGVSTVTLAKLGQQKGDPITDVAWMDAGVSEVAFAQGLIDFIDPDKVTNVTDLFPEALHKAKNGKIFAVSAGFSALGICYNTKEVKIKPDSWLDLWRKEFQGKTTVPSPVNSMGLPFLVKVAIINGGGVNNLMPGLKAMAELKPAAFFPAAGAASNMFQSGDVIIGAHYHQLVWEMADKGLSIGYALPKEGAVAGDWRPHIVKGTKHRDWAEKFINLALSPEAQKGFLELYFGPVNKKVTDLSEKEKQRMPWGYNGSIKSLWFPDFETLRVNREKWSEEWNKVVLGK